MGSSQHFYPESGYLGSSFDHHRAMWATVVALACGVVGAGVGALSLVGGQEFDFPAPRATVEPGYAELSHDFAALQAAVRPGIDNPTGGAGNGGAPDSAEAGLAAPSDAAGTASAPATGAAKGCPQATWPFFDKDCLWGGTAGFGHDDGPRRRIVRRLRSPWCSGLRSNEGAYIGLAGPLMGTVGALACYFVARNYDSNLLLALSYSGFFLNLFNLIPLAPFDGGRITAVLSPRVWLVGAPVLVGIYLLQPNPVLIMMGILSIPQVIKAWRYDAAAPENQAYYGVSKAAKLTYGAAYLALLVFLAVMTHDVHEMLVPVAMGGRQAI